MKFGRLMQNEMPVINRSVSKPALEFQYGRCLSNVSAVDRDISLKFGRPMQNDTLMTKKRSKLKLEVEFQYGSHLFPETGSCYI